jgi:hypothetical protein
VVTAVCFARVLWSPGQNSAGSPAGCKRYALSRGLADPKGDARHAQPVAKSAIWKAVIGTRLSLWCRWQVPARGVTAAGRGADTALDLDTAAACAAIHSE